MGVVLAGIMFLGVVSTAAAVLIGVPGWESSPPEATADAADAQTSDVARASQHPLEPGGTEPAGDRPAAPPTTATATSLTEIAWTTDGPATLEELSGAWAIPRDVLSALNPELRAQRLKAGTKVIVHSHTLGASVSVGPPNDGRLTRGVPLPEGAAWALPEDRTRAFATAESIAALTTSLDAYGQQFPEAEPIQIGDLSARRGGKIFGHQSHQTGRDVDIRLITDATGEGFNAERNWFLVKSLVDGGDVRAIFLNAKEQTWLRSAAEADVGAAPAAQYFALIDHEPGHTIHMHVRFACPKADRRCVGYSQPDTDEHDATRKLPRLFGGKPTRRKSKLPTRRPKPRGSAPVKKRKTRRGKK